VSRSRTLAGVGRTQDAHHFAALKARPCVCVLIRSPSAANTLLEVAKTRATVAVWELVFVCLCLERQWLMRPLTWDSCVAEWIRCRTFALPFVSVSTCVVSLLFFLKFRIPLNMRYALCSSVPLAPAQVSAGFHVVWCVQATCTQVVVIRHYRRARGETHKSSYLDVMLLRRSPIERADRHCFIFWL
jgi:hypothetical protein